MDKMYEIAAAVLGLGRNEIGRDTSPANCESWTSLTHLAMIRKVCDVYEIKLSPKEIVGLRNIGDIEDMLHERGLADE